MINAMMTVANPIIMGENPCTYKLDLTGSVGNLQSHVFVGGYSATEGNIGVLTPSVFLNSKITAIMWAFSNGFRGANIGFTKKLPFKYFMLTFVDTDIPPIKYEEQIDNAFTSKQLLQMPVEQQIPIFQHLVANINKVIHIKLEGFE